MDSIARNQSLAEARATAARKFRASFSKRVALVADVRETCNVTMLEGDHIVYLDRVESDWPLQIRLDVGSHVPLHCTASGKLFLSLGPSSLRNSVLKTKLQRHTPHTLTSTQKLEAELERCARTELGVDHEEFIEGMNAVAVPVFNARRRICATVSVHGPAGRLTMKRALGLVPALRTAAKAIESTF